MRYLVKDVDFFAGFAHAIHTYLGGVALASYHGMSLLHLPFQSAHGLGYAFDDFLAGDARILVAPQVAPVLTSDASGKLYVDGRQTTVTTISRSVSAQTVTQRLRSAPDHSVNWVHKGRFAFADPEPALCVNCTVTPEARYTALWIRERFWRAVRAREEQQQLLLRQSASASPKSSRRKDRNAASAAASAASASAASAAAASPNTSDPIRIAIHVRRGDVTYLDRYSKPSARWVETSDMLHVLRGVRDVLGVPLAPPQVLVHLFSEAKGWYANDTAALHEVAPKAAVHLDSSAGATIDALVTMSRADLLVMGTSGFSLWSAIFSCGVKIGPMGKPMMPMRQVAYSNSLVSRSGPFETAAMPTLKRVWAEYWGCKRDPKCRPSLCGPQHLSSPRWYDSSLAKACVSRPEGAQWNVPIEQTTATTAPIAAAEDDGRSRTIGGWLAARQTCVLKASSLKGGAALTSCVRSRWMRNLTSSLSQKHRMAAATAANSSAAAVRASAAGAASATTAVGAATAAAPAGATAVTGGAAVGVQPSGATAAVIPPVGGGAGSKDDDGSSNSLRQTKTVVRDGKTFLVWADRVVN